MTKKREFILGGLGGPFVMPPKQEGDPDPVIHRVGEQHLLIKVGDQELYVSAHTAARIVAALSMFLNVKLKTSCARKLLL